MLKTDYAITNSNFLQTLNFDQDTWQSDALPDEPLIKFTDRLIENAIQQHVSDIHIEPFQTSCRIRYRCDGILYPVLDISLPLAARLVARLKIMSQMDITEHRLPQDGRFQHQTMDIRINTCPTLEGEKVVLRLLNSGHVQLELSKLGLHDTQYELLLDKISRPQGMILVTGPTGSGKTVTLYSILNHINQNEKNISTVEDPVEIRLSGINQINIAPKIGLDFAAALRALLRQDPDILMIGEIRDRETAGIAIKAAQTGHLVLSTVHANSAIETLSRLQTLGISRHDIAATVSLIISQRLIKKPCRGRTGIYELLPMTKSIAQLILNKASLPVIYQQARTHGFVTLYENGIKKIQQGIICQSELTRVVCE